MFYFCDINLIEKTTHLLFKLLKLPAKLAIKIYCRNIKIQNKHLLNSDGPLLIACNHPNSFLDAIILATLFKKPIYSLARGDAFKNKFIAKLLIRLYILPVYRLSEGNENLNSNYQTFNACRNIFSKNGIVLIFSEGLCVNEWKLRPLKKGTARLALSSWEAGINLSVLPIGINYDSFSRFGKNVQINIGNKIEQNEFDFTSINGQVINDFNLKLFTALKALVVHVDSTDKKTINSLFYTPISSIKKTALFIPSLIGKWLHAPIYIPLQRFCWKKFSKIDHYDSALVGLLFFIYPFYISLFSFAIYILVDSCYWLLPFFILPISAWSFVQLKKQMD